MHQKRLITDYHISLTMANLLRKVWELVSHRSSSASTSNPNPYDLPDRFQLMMYFQPSSTGEFDRIPLDIFIQILKFLGPKESAKLSAVCKSWKFIVTDNRLWIYFLQNLQEPWDSIFFGETQLRSGYPLQLRLTFPTQMPDLSFMDIYAHRAKVPGAIIIDGKAVLDIANLVGANMLLHLGGLPHFWNSVTLSPQCTLDTDISFLPSITASVSEALSVHSRMQVKPYNQPIVVSVPICHSDDTESDRAARRQLKEAMYTALFDMNVPAVCALNQAILALFVARRNSGIVVNVGFHQTSVVPILHGKIMHNVGVEVVGMGALKLTGFLREKMQLKNIYFESLYTVRSLKENLCYVALDYEAELQKDIKASFQTAEGTFTLSKERFQTGEILFQPRMAGVRAMALHQAVALCMDHCHDAELTGDDSWFKTVVLAGGSACLPGLAERLEKELYEILPQSMSSGVKVIPPPYGVDSVWFGAKLVSNLSTFPDSWCVTKKQFRHRSTRRNHIW